jgi:hypothetical protein
MDILKAAQSEETLRTKSSPYQSLPPDNIRLLQIQNLEHNLTCELETHSVDTVPAYEALSYVWGRSAQKCGINCNGKTLYITPDLLEFLKRLYKGRIEPEGISKTFRIWIDAICINQSDSGEKAEQIPLMGKIYSGAQQVIVWLGEAADESDLAIKGLPSIVEGMAKFDGLVTPSDVPFLLTDDARRLFKAISHLTHRSWFCRTWVIQEVALAKKILVLCGDAAFDWTLLPSYVNAVNRCGLGPLALAEYQAGAGGADNYSSIIEIELIRGQLRDEYSIPRLLQLGRGQECTEAVDRIWAFLGMFPKFLRDNIAKEELIDLSDGARREYWRTYTRFARWLVESLQTLSFLALAPSLRRYPYVSHPQLPTWVPDWASVQDHKHLGFEMQHYHAGYESKSDQHDRHQLPEVSVLPDHYLIVLGFRVDEVKMVVDYNFGFTQFPNGLLGEDGDAAKLLLWEDSLLGLLHSFHPERSRDEIIDALWRTLIGNRTIHADKELTIANYHSWKSVLSKFAQNVDPGDISPDELKSYVFFMQHHQWFFQGRRFILTERGRFGAAPKTVAVGDTICVIKANHLLWALRFSLDGHKANLTGDVYVHGLMNGQAFGAPESSPEENFILS